MRDSCVPKYVPMAAPHDLHKIMIYMDKQGLAERVGDRTTPHPTPQNKPLFGGDRPQLSVLERCPRAT